MEQISPRLLDFDQNRIPIPPRDAATVVVLRDGDDGLEAFLVRRHHRSSFLGSALVFPGGKVDVQDCAEDVWVARATMPASRAALFATEAMPARALCVAACREMLEEAALIPVDRPVSDAELLDMRRESTDGTSLSTCLERRGLKLTLADLIPWARWITPEAESRRFDARFFLLSLPPGQVGRHDDRETTMSFWSAPSDVLARAAQGEFFLAPPTSRTLELLATVDDLRSAVALAEQQSLLPICPRFVPGDADNPPFLALPGDPAHEIRERRTAGATRYVLRDGVFISEERCARGSPNHIKHERETGSTTSSDDAPPRAPSAAGDV